jgi:hypothetical protein
MAALQVAAVAATKRRRKRLRKLPWLAAGVGAFAAGDLRAQSNLEFRYLFYQESGGRTEVSNPWLYLNQDFGLKGGQLTLLLGYDAISGASPTGGYPTLDATTSASGATSSSIPLANYVDTRQSASVSYARKFGAHLPSVDLSYSRENDYLSRGGGLTDAWTMANGRGALHLGLAISRDIVTPVATPANPVRVSYPKSSDAFALGFSWIVGERDLLDVSASLTNLSGYLTDPYKIVPIGTGTATAPEIRPDARSRYAVVFKYGHYFADADGALKLGYRYYWDDWSIGAHTIDLLYDKRVGTKWIVSPLLRLYTQSHASFFSYQFAAPQTSMSSDYRLSAFDSILGGLTLSYNIRRDLVVSLGATYQFQQGRDRVVPLAAVVPPPLLHAPFGEGEGEDGGPATVSAADMTVITGTFGLSWRY